jgi:hypothetical protein
MAARFWVGGTGNWDASTTTNWSATSSGAGGASVPTSADDVTFDSGSGTAATVTITAAANANSITVNKSDLILIHNAGSTVAGAVTLTIGTLNTNGQTCNWGKLSSNNANVRTLTLGASVITLTINGNCLDFTNGTNFTFQAGTSSFISTGPGAAIASDLPAANFYDFTATGSGVFSVTGSQQGFHNFTRTAAPGVVSQLSQTNIICSNLLTLTGTSTNRLLVQGTVNVLGIQRTVTAAAVSLNYVDFVDIKGAGAATWSGTSLGDGQGNSSITFDSPLTLYRVGAAGNWSDSNWALTSGGATGQRIPLPQDSVFVDANASGAVSGNVARLGGNINFTGFTGNLSLSTTPNGIYGNLTLASGMTLGGVQSISLYGRGSQTLTSAGLTFTQQILINGPGGTYTLQDNFATSRNIINSLFVVTGTLNDGGKNVLVSGATGTASIAVGGGLVATGTWTFSGTTPGAQPTFAASSAATVTATSQTIIFSSATPNSLTFAGGGKSYGTLTYTVANSPGALIITGANTFANLNVGPGRTLTMPSGSANVINGNFNAVGAPNGSLYLPGASANYVTTPDSTALSITGDFTLLVRVAFNDWTPAVFQTLIGKWGAGINFSYNLGILAAGTLELSVSTNGTTQVDAISSVAPAIADGAALWVLASWRASDGRAQFFTASGALANPAASDFTQLGTDRSAVVANIFNSTGPVEVGSYANAGGGFGLGGNFYRGKIYNGVFSTAAFGGTVQLDADFTIKPVGANTFTELSSNAVTMSIVGPLAQVGDGRVALNASTPGSAATLTKTTGVVNDDYLTIQDSTANGGATWYAGSHSVNVSNNSGWVFTGLATGRGGFMPFFQ